MSSKGRGLNFFIQATSVQVLTAFFILKSTPTFHLPSPSPTLRTVCRHAPPPSPAQSAVAGPAFLQDSQNGQPWTSALFHPLKYASRCEALQLSLFLVTFTQAVWMKAQPEGQMICSPPSSLHPSGEHTEIKINLFTTTEANPEKLILCGWI